MLSFSEDMLQRLKLPYRLMQCCTGDLGVKNASMIDVETWMPVARPAATAKPTPPAGSTTSRPAAAISATSTADGKVLLLPHAQQHRHRFSPRILIPILECCQNADGSVTVPEALRPYMGGMERFQAQP